LKSIAALDISKPDDQDDEFVECDEWEIRTISVVMFLIQQIEKQCIG
jgi:hypothetical protein